ncbi:hypothetical protein [Streptomyces sp. URMC 124]|uniref:hypothetical protein n=1 Tax=Streptomyces sp. URMC 124 TaxID=3423405 RepID=UPI003F1C41AA
MPDALNIPNELFDLQRASDAERGKLAGLDGGDYDAQWRAWREAAERAQAAITDHAAAAGLNRFEVEKAVKKMVRHSE